MASKKPAGKNPAESLKDLLLKTLDDNKAEDIVTVPLDGKSALADYMIIASGRSARHVVALAELLGEALHKLGRPARYEGRDSGDWVLTDAGDVIVHLFRPEVRSFYNLEKMWCQPDDTVPVAEGPARKVAGQKRRRAAATA
ncbi:MAG: ribosome silencing factor [Alphaproteobacteria bacterium]|nr:ribosome silencing factor [Alphaproteobacteria bacterium]